MKEQTEKLFGSKILFALALVLAMAIGAASAFGEPWKFGVMSDTQWTVPDDPAGQNPNGVSVSIISQINKQFIKAGVKFVIQVGDLTENGYDADIAVRAAAAQELYKAGIGFFPMRGNHETYAKPEGSNNYGIPAVQRNFPQTRGISNTFGATHFNSPTPLSTDLDGMSYSFDYGSAGNSARFIIIDDWATPSKRVDAANYRYGYSIADQQGRISSRLDKNTRGTQHAFVFSHQNLIGENHQDSLFSGYTNANPDMQNTFFSSLQNNDVKYYMSGHDHIHQRSIITSPDGSSKVQEIIGASDSSKFYTPKNLTDPNWYGQKHRQTSISQELYAVGYYLFTVDGPRVTVDYYADDHGSWQSDKSYPEGPKDAGSHITPTFNFVKKETWGYSLNGKEFLIGGTQGTSYTVVQDSYGNMSAQILSGTYGNKATDYNKRVLTQTVDTGWTPDTSDSLASNILTLWGMAGLGSPQTDVYTLSMSYDPNRVRPIHPGKGGLGIATRNADGNWVNAVNMNSGGTKKFVDGPWDPRYELGTYGADPRTKTAWAVINYNGDFAVALDVESVPGYRK